LAPSDRTVEHASHKRVQQFKGKIELLGFSQRGLRILSVLGTPDCTASDAAKIVGCSKSLVSHWKDHATKVGALRLQTDGILEYTSSRLLELNFLPVQRISLRVRGVLQQGQC
jgi:hypothetical protein